MTVFRLPTDASLWITDIGEPGTNDLRVLVAEVGPEAEAVETEFGPAFPVTPTQNGRVFEVYWPCYVTYAVRNESYFNWESGETYTGPTGERTDSALLAYVAATTFATDDYPGPLRHWFLYTEWHCIDVVSVDPPEVRVLDAADAEAERARIAADDRVSVSERRPAP